MKRKYFEYKGLKFYERNKEDVDFSGISERYKAYNFRFIQEHTKGEDDKLAMLGMEMHKEYTASELTLFMYGDMKEIRMCLWQSHLQSENSPNREQMYKAVDGQEKQVLALLLKLENPESKKKVTTTH